MVEHAVDGPQPTPIRRPLLSGRGGQPSLRVVLSTISEFHVYHVARQLHERAVLERLFTGQPRWRLRGKGLPLEKTTTFPYLQMLFEALARAGVTAGPLQTELNWACHQSLDAYVARRIPECDIFDALSYNGLRSGRRAQEQGARWVCRLPGTHMGYQDAILREEHARVGLPYKGQDGRFLAYAQASYAGADLILTQSRFARQTFIACGVPAEKVAVVPTNPRRPLPGPPASARRAGRPFEVLYVGQLSARKGIHDLVRAFQLAAIPNSRLRLVGAILPETPRLLGDPGPTVELLGVQRKDKLARFYAEADVFVLASVEEGLAGVLCEALAHGCPVIASEHTGARDLLTDGVEGFIVPIRSPEAIAEKLVWLSDHPLERAAMREAAQGGAAAAPGWAEYGERLLDAYSRLLA